MRAALFIGPILLTLSLGAHAQPPTPIEIPWDAIVVEETFTPGTVSREVEPIHFWLDLQPGMQITHTINTQAENSARESMRRWNYQYLYHVIEQRDDGLWAVDMTRHDLGRWVKEGRRWVEDPDRNPDEIYHLLIDGIARLVEIESDWSEERGEFTRLRDEAKERCITLLPPRDARPGDSWSGTLHFEGVDGIEARSTGTLLRIEEEGGQQIAVIGTVSDLDITVPIDAGHREYSGGRVMYTMTEAHAHAEATIRFNLDTGRHLSREGTFEETQRGVSAIETGGMHLDQRQCEITWIGDASSEVRYDE